MLTKQALGNTLFGMADILRDKVEDYKSYILTLLFFKRLSDNYSWEIEQNIAEFKQQFGTKPNEKQLAMIIAKKHEFMIPEGCFWGDVRQANSDKKNDVLNHAVTQIAEVNPSLKGIINTVRWNEPSPDGSGGKKLHPEVLTLLISYLDAVDLSNRNVSVDVLGDAYEYLIKRFADENKGGTMAGQFYTPQEIVDIIVGYLKPFSGATVYDPTCGSGGFLIKSAKFIKRQGFEVKRLRLFGQEDVWNTWAIASINMMLHGLAAQIKKGDTLRDPKFTEEENPLNLKQFDLVMANFPFSLENWWKNGNPKKDKKGKAVAKKDGSPQLEYPGKEEFADPYDRFVYGLPPFSNGDFAFIQHIVASMNERGRAGVVCPQGVLFRGQPEKTEEEDGQNRKADDEYGIRRGLLQGIAANEERNLIEAIVVLPSKLFYGTPIPGSIIFFNQQKSEARQNQVLMVYAAREGWYKEEANMNVLLPQDILRISTILESWGDLETAKVWIDSQKVRLGEIIQEDLSFKLDEIERDFAEDITIQQAKLDQAIAAVESREGKVPKSLLNSRDRAQESLDKLKRERLSRIEAAEVWAEKERLAIAAVEEELLTMLVDPELRKRYFAVVDMAELEENEFNLNIPRYVDTFEPEEEIDLKMAIKELKTILSKESDTTTELDNFLKKLG